MKNTDEEYLKERWVQHPLICQELKGGFPIFGQVRAKHWQAARAFTEAREEEIRQVEEEIALLESFAPVIDRDALDAWAGIDEDPGDDTIHDYEPLAVENAKFQVRMQRILAREQAALAELKRGMK